MQLRFLDITNHIKRQNNKGQKITKKTINHKKP